MISPHLVNVVGYGYTRLGTASTGNPQSIRPSTSRRSQPTPRASQRVSPITNITDDLTWTKGRHTAQFGGNMRFIENDRTAFNNLPSYSFSRNTLLGLGGDITANVLSLMQSRYGSGVKLSSGTNVTNALGPLFGMVNQYSATYNFGADGKAIPFGDGLGEKLRHPGVRVLRAGHLQVEPQPDHHLWPALLHRPGARTNATACR